MLDVAIIGCGVIGAAAAYELSHYPLQTAIFEAENDVADCTTKANSAILHAGYDPEPGTRMARLNVEGSALAKEICARLDVPYLQCGSLVLALSPEELPHLQKLYENGIANGVPGIRLLSAEETLAMEPNLAPTVVGALYAPSAAIVSPWEFALAMAEVAVRNGVELHRSCPVTHIEKTAGGWALTTPSGIVETRYIINAAGISAQAVHDMAAPHKFTIQPTRGEYYLLDKSEGSRVHHVIFQCPNENGKGVLVAPTVHGNLIVGPNADPVEGDDTACTAAGERHTVEGTRLEDGTFQAEGWVVPLGGDLELSVTVTAGGGSRTETLETLSADPGDYRLGVEGGWETNWKDGTVRFTSLTLHISPNPDVPLALERVELAVFPNGEAEPLWSAPLPEAAELWRRQGYVQMYLTAEDYMPAIPLEEGAELLAAAKITDDHGQSFWYLLEAARNDDGTLRSVPAPMLKDACPNWQPGGYVSPQWPGP